MRSFETYGAIRTRTYSAIADDDAIKTSIATSLSVATYITAGLNGAIGATALAITQLISVTTSAQAATYNVTTPITITGTDILGRSITDTLLLLTTGGGETIYSTVPFASVVSIAVPVQLTVNGTFKFGVGDIYLNESIRAIRGGAAGNLKVAYQGGFIDTVPVVASERQDILAQRIYDVGTTALPITVYL